MKKNILIGILSTLVNFLVCNILNYVILAGEYNEFGELINMTSETVTLAADEKTTKEFALLSATAQNNKTMSMIWADNNQPLLKIN